MVEKMKPRVEDAAINAGLAEITVINPATEQILTVTVKKFESIYQDKGFQIVDRGNVGTHTKAKAGTDAREPSSQTGSAASIAQRLGIEQMPADNAETGVTEDVPPHDVPPDGAPPAETMEMKTFAEAAAAKNQTDENDSDSDVSVATEPRETGGRGRPGRPKVNRSA